MRSFMNELIFLNKCMKKKTYYGATRECLNFRHKQEDKKMHIRDVPAARVLSPALT